MREVKYISPNDFEATALKHGIPRHACCIMNRASHAQAVDFEIRERGIEANDSTGSDTGERFR